MAQPEVAQVVSHTVVDPDARARDTIRLLNINAATLKNVLEYCAHPKDNIILQEFDPLYDGSSGQQKASEWEAQFVQVDHGILFDIIQAANYLDIKPLLDLGTKSVSDSIKGKTPEEIRKIFSIASDFTPEEEAQIKRENVSGLHAHKVWWLN